MPFTFISMQMKILSTKKYLAHWKKNAKVINRQSVGELSISIYHSTEHLNLDFAKVLTDRAQQAAAEIHFDDISRSARLSKDGFWFASMSQHHI